MADRIVINFGAETREVEVAGRRMSDVLKDTQDGLEDVGTTGEDSLEKVTKNADDAAESTDKLGKGVGGELTDAFGKFDGTANGALESVADGVGSLAALVPGVGGLIGAGLGTALSEGVKLFTANVDAEAKANEERIQTMYENFIESGLTYYTAAQSLAAVADIQGDTERYNALLEQSKVLGIDIQTIVLAQVQAGAERNEVQSRANELLEADNKALEDGTYNLGTHLTTVEAIVGQYQQLNGQQTDATEKAAVYGAIAEKVTGQQKLTNEEIQIQNRLLGQTPKEITTKLTVDSSGLDAIERTPRRVRVDLVDRFGKTLF